MDALDIAEQFSQHLNSPKQTWLFGAGISYNANIPLMYPLTELVFDRIKKNDKANNVLTSIKGECGKNSHIEHHLTYLGDLISLANQAESKKVLFSNAEICESTLLGIYKLIISEITKIIRWGHKSNCAQENQSHLQIDEHLEFVKAIFNTSRAGLDLMRSPVEFYTTNYDTLLEDALALNRIHYRDGFSGGAVAFWDPADFGRKESVKARLYKLHGSINWYQKSDDNSYLFRIRHEDNYPMPKSGENGNVMIYPQATKYLNTQRDPFAQLFQKFRKRLADGVDHVLFICGYSFGDEHINAEIEQAMRSNSSQLTLIAFVKEPTDLIKIWGETPWGERVFVVSSEGLYQGSSGPHFSDSAESSNWWTFDGVTKLINTGLPADIQEKMQ